ncbi:hypothetical protein HAX54_005932, partial [Datura stramonium]|nr:hypothetical protein [Datura stramonium]
MMIYVDNELGNTFFPRDEWLVPKVSIRASGYDMSSSCPKIRPLLMYMVWGIEVASEVELLPRQYCCTVKFPLWRDRNSGLVTTV